MTLLVLAAGMGSRYGGIKQIEGVGENGELIIDYSLFDAITAGFDKAVFVIRKSIEADFCERFFNRIKDKINATYVFQEIPEGRTRPWGTTDAVMAARDAIDGPFCVINADDFYGASSYKSIAEFFRKDKGDYAMVGYQLRKTISDFGAVTRGVIDHDGKGNVTDINERKNVVKDGEKMFYITDGKTYNELPYDTSVSLTFFGLSPSIFPLLAEKLKLFKAQNADSPTAEAIIAQDIGDLLKEGKIELKLLESLDDWHGFTYPEDKEKVATAIREMVRDGKYPRTLWQTLYLAQGFATTDKGG